MNKTHKKVIGYFQTKDLLGGKDGTPWTGTPIPLHEIIETGHSDEPRIFKMLPTVIIHFPGDVTGLESMPQELRDVIEAIKRGDERGPDCYGVQFEEVKDWVDTHTAWKEGKMFVRKRKFVVENGKTVIR